jgi:hypothetical protein
MQNGEVGCAILEAYKPNGNQAYNCETDSMHLGRVTASHVLVTPEITAAFPCICEMLQLRGAQLTSCQNQIAMDVTANGWCYVDPAQSTIPDLTEACNIVRDCAPTEERKIRFSPSAERRAGASTFLNCAPRVLSLAPNAGGAACPGQQTP